MSYSRWSNSHWYTYWFARESNERDEQIFEICALCCFTYKQIKENFETCISEVREKDPKATDKQIEELRGYIKEWIYAVETDQKINDYMRVKESSLKELPLLIGEIKTDDARNFLSERLKGL